MNGLPKSRHVPLRHASNHPYTISVDGLWMVRKMRVAESEKITINLGFVDLGQIDLLVREGFYGNRTDFIRTAIRNQLDRHGDATRQSASRRQLQVGLCHLSASDLETARGKGEMLDLRVLGLLTIAPDVTPALAQATIASATVLGAVHASSSVKAALADRFT